MFGVIFAKILRIDNLRKNGSGNVGATNIARVSGSKLIGVMVGLFDMMKGFIPLFLAETTCIEQDELLMIGCAAVLGHIFPIWNGLKGGKGVATFLGVNLAFDLRIGALMACGWGVTFFLTKISSLSSLIMVTICTICYLYYFEFSDVFPMIFMSLIILWKHKDNIRRLINGAEKPLNK